MTAVDWFSEFESLTFPRSGNIVYIIGIQKGPVFHPIYVGESSRHVGRFGDYVSGKFSASTDFKVGQAAAYLLERGYDIVIKYSPAADRKGEQACLIDELQSQGLRLLNQLEGYIYRTADRDLELKKIRAFVNDLLAQRNL